MRLSQKQRRLAAIRSFEQPRNNANVKFKRGIASKYFSQVGDLTGKYVFVAAGVTTPSQADKGNLSDQSLELRQIAAKRGGTVVHVKEHTGPGDDPRWLREFRRIAIQMNLPLEDCVILAETTNRVSRHPDFDPKTNRLAKARDPDLDWTYQCARGIPIQTVLHPDASLAEVSKYHMERGQRAKGNRGGRKKKRRYAQNHRQVVSFNVLWACRWKSIFSLRQVAKELGRPISTIRDWIKRFEVDTGIPWKG